MFLPRNAASGDSLIKEDIIETLPNQDVNTLPPAFDQVPMTEEGAE
jgi:hypothetical protein